MTNRQPITSVAIPSGVLTGVGDLELLQETGRAVAVDVDSGTRAVRLPALEVGRWWVRARTREA